MTVLGLLMLLIGVIAAAAIFFNVLGIVSGDDGEPPLVSHVVKLAGEQVENVETGDSPFRLSPETSRLAAYIVVAFFYAIAGGIALAFVRAGVSLLQPELGQAMLALTRRLDALHASRKG